MLFNTFALTYKLVKLRTGLSFASLCPHRFNTTANKIKLREAIYMIRTVVRRGVACESIGFMLNEASGKP